jgi:hypothetical protein
VKLSAILAPLIAAGVPGEVILATVKAFEDQQIDASEKGKEKARARWRKWKDKQPTNVGKRLQTPANVSNTLTRVEDSSSKKDITGEEERKIEAPAALSPRGELEKVLDAEHAAAVVEHRQRLKKPLTPRAARLLANSLSKAPDANAAADMMIEKGWQSFELAWLENRTAPRPHSTASPPYGKRMNAVEANLARRQQKNGTESGRRDNGNAELLPPDEPRLPAFIGDVGKAITWSG